MSYEIVKNVRVVKGENGYHATLTTACNNCWPRYYSEWNMFEGKGKTKEEIEKILLVEFFRGNLQGGNSRFKKTCQLIPQDNLKRYYRISKTIDKLRKRYHNNNIPTSEKRKSELHILMTAVYDLYEQELGNALYAHMYASTKERNLRKVHPFIIMRKSNGEYVTRVGRTKFYTSAWHSKPHLFTSATLWNRVHNSPYWNENFIIEQVSATLDKRYSI